MFLVLRVSMFCVCDLLLCFFNLALIVWVFVNGLFCVFGCFPVWVCLLGFGLW